MTRRRPLARRIADLWAEAGHAIRVAIVLILTVIVACCVGCSGSVKPWADIELKDDAERRVDPRWGFVQQVWIGITLEF